MISWWWLLIVGLVSFSLGVTIAMRSIRLGVGRMIKKPPPEVKAFLDQTLNVIGNQTFETAAQVAEAHQMVVACQKNCGGTIAQGIREVAIKARMSQAMEG